MVLDDFVFLFLLFFSSLYLFFFYLVVCVFFIEAAVNSHICMRGEHDLDVEFYRVIGV